MPRNEHRQDDLLYVTQPTRNILLALGTWPSLDARSKGWKFHHLLLITISYVLFSCDIIPGVLYCLMQETIYARLQVIPLLLYDIMSASQYGIFILRRDRLRQCLRYVEQDWRDVLSANSRNLMLRSAWTGKRLVTICGIFMFCSMLLFRIVLPLSRENIVTDENVTIRPLACPGYYFSLDVQVSPVYETVFALQCLTGFIMASVLTSACGLTTIFVAHACGQLKILINLMNSLVEQQWSAEHEVDKKLAEIVQHQVKIRR